jgi:hypothetical protein
MKADNNAAGAGPAARCVNGQSIWADDMGFAFPPGGRSGEEFRGDRVGQMQAGFSNVDRVAVRGDETGRP